MTADRVPARTTAELVIGAPQLYLFAGPSSSGPTSLVTTQCQPGGSTLARP